MQTKIYGSSIFNEESIYEISKPLLDYFMNGCTDTRTDVLTKIFLLEKVANKAKSTQQVPSKLHGINLILTLLAPLICRLGLFRK